MSHSLHYRLSDHHCISFDVRDSLLTEEAGGNDEDALYLRSRFAYSGKHGPQEYFLYIKHWIYFCLCTSILAFGSVCRPPFFNSKAHRSDECRRCFCHERTRNCRSAQLYSSKVNFIMYSMVLTLSAQEMFDIQFTDFVFPDNICLGLLRLWEQERAIAC